MRLSIVVGVPDQDVQSTQSPRNLSQTVHKATVQSNPGSCSVAAMPSQKLPVGMPHQQHGGICTGLFCAVASQIWQLYMSLVAGLAAMSSALGCFFGEQKSQLVLVIAHRSAAPLVDANGSDVRRGSDSLVHGLVRQEGFF